MIEVIVAVFTGVATVALACITGYYAWLTNRYVCLTREILTENQQMRLDAQKPKIAVYLRQVLDNSRNQVHLIVENIGMGPAYDVRFETDLSFKVSESQSLGNIPIFVKGINYLQPRGQKHCWINTNSRSRLDEVRQSPLKIDVTYKDSRNNEYPESFCIDFNENKGVLDYII